MLRRRGRVAVGRSTGAVHACVPTVCRLCVNCSGVARVHPDPAHLPFTPRHLSKSSRGRPRKKEKENCTKKCAVDFFVDSFGCPNEQARKLIVPACATPSGPIDPSFVSDSVQVRQLSLFPRAIRLLPLLLFQLVGAVRCCAPQDERKKKVGLPMYCCCGTDLSCMGPLHQLRKNCELYTKIKIIGPTDH